MLGMPGLLDEAAPMAGTDSDRTHTNRESPVVLGCVATEHDDDSFRINRHRRNTVGSRAAARLDSGVSLDL